jgi:hypothetical protein
VRSVPTLLDNAYDTTLARKEPVAIYEILD